MGIVQEKNQLEFMKAPDDRQNKWVDCKRANVKKGTPYGNTFFPQSLPPGSDVTDQALADIRKMRTITAGTDDVTDNPSGQDFVKGYVDVQMKPTDDMYTNEHVDAFYGEGKSDGKVGFLERNNVLDRN